MSASARSRTHSAAAATSPRTVPAEGKPFVEDYLLYLLGRASMQASAQFHSIAKARGLSVLEWRVLGQLSSGPETVSTLAVMALSKQPTLTKVVEARAKATSIQVTPETLNDPAAFQKFQAAQGELGSALSRLMVVSERYPDLKANQGFRDLRVQLEGTENRITVARNRYIQTVQEYNVLTRSFPNNLTAMMFGYQVKPNFTVQNEAQISTPPVVDFNKK